MLPNFFLVGANKAGTTSIHRYLRHHPEIYMSRVKEPTFWALDPEQPQVGKFAEDVVRDRGEYEALFADVTTERAFGEASTAYLTSKLAPERIRAEIPEARVIAVLRDPSDRAYSSFMMHVAAGKEPITDFGTAVDTDLSGETWRYYVVMGRYGSALQRWHDRFPAEQIRVFLYEDLSARPDCVMREIYEFLDVDADFTPMLDDRFNVTYMPRNRTLAQLVKGPSAPKRALKRVLSPSLRAALKHRAIGWNSTRPAPPPPEVRARLIEVYADDIVLTERLTGRDLSAWRTV